jgi:RNA polymerase sigma-70 factor (ECF subfamily)
MGTASSTFSRMPLSRDLYNGDTESSIVLRILNGQQDLFRDLIEPHLQILRNVVRSRMGNDPEVEDVIQTAVVKAFANLKQFRFEAGFRTWLIRIAHNEVSQNWRRKLVARQFTHDQAGLAVNAPDPGDSPFKVYARSQTARSIEFALSTLPEKYRIIVRMRDLDELSIAEVSQAMRLTIATVKTRHRRGRLIMAQLLTGKKRVARSIAD